MGQMHNPFPYIVSIKVVPVTFAIHFLSWYKLVCNHKPSSGKVYTCVLCKVPIGRFGKKRVCKAERFVLCVPLVYFFHPSFEFFYFWRVKMPESDLGFS